MRTPTFQCLGQVKVQRPNRRGEADLYIAENAEGFADLGQPPTARPHGRNYPPRGDYSRSEDMSCHRLRPRKLHSSDLTQRRPCGSCLAALPSQDRRIKMFGNAEAYDRFMGRWSRLLAPLLVDFSQMHNTGRVLDVGSGTGALALSIARSKIHCQVLAIDPSKGYVEFANSRNPFPDRVGFQVGDAQQLCFSEATFQASLSLLVFNFIADSKKALRELSRVTKPGGCVSGTVWDYGSGMRMLRVFWDAAATVDPTAGKFDELHMPLCHAGELEELWLRSGLEQVAERPLDIVMRFESLADYWDTFLLGQGPAGVYLRNVDGDHREVLRCEARRRLALASEDTSFSLAGRAWAVRGIVPNRR
jgi:SAM-dependent methyltransferase